jgi:hypothetical protein
MLIEAGFGEVLKGKGFCRMVAGADPECSTRVGANKVKREDVDERRRSYCRNS